MKHLQRKSDKEIILQRIYNAIKNQDDEFENEKEAMMVVLKLMRKSEKLIL